MASGNKASNCNLKIEEGHNGIATDCDASKIDSRNYSEDTDISTESSGGQNISGSPVTKNPKLGLETVEDQLSINNNNNSRTSNNKNSNLTPIKMQTEGIRVPGLNQELSREITKFDSSEFDVSDILYVVPFKLQSYALHRNSYLNAKILCIFYLLG